MREAGGVAASRQLSKFIFRSPDGTFWGALKMCLGEGVGSIGGLPRQYLGKPLSRSDPSTFLCETGMGSIHLALLTVVKRVKGGHKWERARKH